MKILTLMGLFLASLGAHAATNLSPSDSLHSRIKEIVQGELSGGTRVVLEKVYLKESIPTGASITVMRPHPPLGLVNFEFSWSESGRLMKVRGKAVVRGYAPIAVAKKPISHGGFLNSDNIRFEERELTAHALTGYFVGWDALRKNQVKGYVRPGAILNGANTEKIPLVVRGQSVKVIHHRGVLRVTANMVAMESGKEGDWIRVQNPQSKRVLRAKVSGTGILRTQ